MGLVSPQSMICLTTPLRNLHKNSFWKIGSIRQLIGMEWWTNRVSLLASSSSILLENEVIKSWFYSRKEGMNFGPGRKTAMKS